MTEVSGPPILRVGHQGAQVLDNLLQIETLELLGVIESRTHRVGLQTVLVEDLQAQLLRPPVAVGPSGPCVRYRALAGTLNSTCPLDLRVHNNLRNPNAADR